MGDAFLAGARAIQVFGIDSPGARNYLNDYLGKSRSKCDKSRDIPLRDPSEVSLEVSAKSGLQYILRSGESPLILN